MKKQSLFLNLCLLLCLGGPEAIRAQSKAITYQGRLTQNGLPLDGQYQIRFRVFAEPQPAGGQSLATVTQSVSVVNGVFTAMPEFIEGPDTFDGKDRWLEIGVAAIDNPDLFTALVPRQIITHVPYALHSAKASGPVEGVPWNFGEQVMFNADSGPPFSVVSSNKVGGLNVDLFDGLDSTEYWQLSGNNIVPGKFLGTVNSQALELRVNNSRALRIEPTGGSPNIIGGAGANSVGAAAEGATISGGGSLLGGNQVSGIYSTIGGGHGNGIAGGSSLIGGGEWNSVMGSNSVIGGGRLNTNFGTGAVIAGGTFNYIPFGFDFFFSFGSVISGGSGNVIMAICANIGGGLRNIIQTNADYATISGGLFNTIETRGWSATIGGGRENIIQTNAQFAAIAGGDRNTIQPNAGYATIGGGSQHIIETNATHTTISGGFWNIIHTDSSYATIGGGDRNRILPEADYGTIGGGRLNTIHTNADSATIGGGNQNVIQPSARQATIGGGLGNTIFTNATCATIGGGDRNRIRSETDYGTIGGGRLNTIQTNADFGTIPGGLANEAAAYAFAAGHRAHATNTGAFVWSDSGVGNGTGSTNENSVTFRARGGYRLFSDDGGLGVFLAPNSGTWTSMSDRNAKEAFAPIDSRAVLDKVAALAVQTWRYKGQDETVRHMGPMAQDFRAAFAVGDSELGISTVDADGVALAAIQGLDQKVEAENAALRADLQTKAERIAGLERRLATLERLLSADTKQ